MLLFRQIPRKTIRNYLSLFLRPLCRPFLFHNVRRDVKDAILPALFYVLSCAVFVDCAFLSLSLCVSIPMYIHLFTGIHRCKQLNN